MHKTFGKSPGSISYSKSQTTIVVKFGIAPVDVELAKEALPALSH